MTIAHDREEPRLDVAAAQSVEASEGAQHRLLHDVVRIGARTGQPACETIRRIQVRQHLRIETGAPLLRGTPLDRHDSRLSLIGQPHLLAEDSRPAAFYSLPRRCPGRRYHFGPMRTPSTLVAGRAPAFRRARRGPAATAGRSVGSARAQRRESRRQSDQFQLPAVPQSRLRLRPWMRR